MASELMSAQLDSCLTDEEKETLQRHLAGCAECRSEWLWMQRADALFQGVAPVAPPPLLAQTIMARIRRRGAWMAVLHGGMILLLGVVILAGMVWVPVVAFGPLATVSNSPATVSAVVSAMARMMNVLVTLLQAAYLVLRALVSSPGIVVLALYAALAAALALWWIRIVARPEAIPLRKRIN